MSIKQHMLVRPRAALPSKVRPLVPPLAAWLGDLAELATIRVSKYVPGSGSKPCIGFAPPTCVGSFSLAALGARSTTLLYLISSLAVPHNEVISSASPIRLSLPSFSYSKDDSHPQLARQRRPSPPNLHPPRRSRDPQDMLHARRLAEQQHALQRFGSSERLLRQRCGLPQQRPMHVAGQPLGQSHQPRYLYRHYLAGSRVSAILQ